MRVPARRDPFLLLASGAAVALLATVALVPNALWRMPLAVFGGLWAPGYALVSLVWRHGALSRLERHALAAGAGLLLAPVVALATSELVGFGAVRVAGALAALTIVAAWLAPRVDAREPPAVSPVPSTRVTLAASVSSLALAGIILSTSFATTPELHSLALTAPDGSPATLRWDAGAPPPLRLTAVGGDEPVEAPLLARWDDATVIERPVRVQAGGTAIVDFAPPADAALGNHTFRATWAGRQVHAAVFVAPAQEAPP